MDIPVLLDVPIVIPRAGGYCLTMPIKQGDECLVVFGDMCIDGWWHMAAYKIKLKREDMIYQTDGFAILGTWSQPRVIKDYSTDSASKKRNRKFNYRVEE